MLKNVKRLRDDMRATGWIITAFPFSYNGIKYVVLFEDFKPTDEENKYMIARLTFIDESDLSRTLECLANSVRLKYDGTLSEFRNYFGIKFTENAGDIFEQFQNYLGRFIPDKWTKPNALAQKIMVRRLDKAKPDAIYCYDARHNGVKLSGEPMQRTEYNDNKTRLLRPYLYKMLGQDSNISFYYSDKPEDERSDAEILAVFSGRDGLRS